MGRVGALSRMGSASRDSAIIRFIKLSFGGSLLELSQTEDVGLRGLSRGSAGLEWGLSPTQTASSRQQSCAVCSCSTTHRLQSVGWTSVRSELLLTFPEKGERYLARLFSSIFLAIFLSDAPKRVPYLPTIPTFLVLLDIFLIIIHLAANHPRSPANSLPTRCTHPRTDLPSPPTTSNSNPVLPPNSSPYFFTQNSTAFSGIPRAAKPFTVALATVLLYF